MKLLRRILLAILVLCIIIIAVGFLLPGQVRIERSLTMNAGSETIFHLVNNLRYWKKWSPWHNIDTAMLCEYSGPESGEGAVFSYHSTHKNVGNGEFTIIKSHPYDSIVMLMDFMENGKTTAKFIFHKTNEGTQVTWVMESRLDRNPVSRWFGLFTDRMLGFDLETGLSFLNDLASSEIHQYEQLVMEKDVPVKFALTVRDTASPATYAVKLELMFKKISALIISKNLKVTGPPFSTYYSYSPQSFDMEAGIPVDRRIPDQDSVRFMEFPACRAVMISFFGPYQATAKAYEAIEKYIDKHQLTVAGGPWEEYLTDPVNEPDTNQWQTDIYYPIN